MTMLQEALLWKTALRYLGPSNLYQTVVDLWGHAGVPARSTVEYLTNDTVGDEVVIILKKRPGPSRSYGAWPRGGAGYMCFVQSSRGRACRRPIGKVACA